MLVNMKCGYRSISLTLLFLALSPAFRFSSYPALGSPFPAQTDTGSWILNSVRGDFDGDHRSDLATATCDSQIYRGNSICDRKKFRFYGFPSFQNRNQYLRRGR